MTRNEAIDLLDNLIGMVEDNHCSDYDTALRMGIKALEQSSGDTISRQGAIKAIDEKAKRIKNEDTLNGLAGAVGILFDLPPVKPQPKTGHWIYDYTSADGHKTYHCSECGCYLQPKHSEPLNSFKWCSSCGARMVEEQERSDKE